jgi:hypothetical protein
MARHHIQLVPDDEYEPDPDLVAWAKRINDRMPPLTPEQRVRLWLLVKPVREALHREAHTRPNPRIRRRGAA